MDAAIQPVSMIPQQIHFTIRHFLKIHSHTKVHSAAKDATLGIFCGRIWKLVARRVTSKGEFKHLAILWRGFASLHAQVPI
jgi:hypothetical protein